MNSTKLVIIFIVFFVLLFITYPFKITWRFHINLLENLGFVVFKVLFIRLLCERFKISNFEIKTEREKEKKRKNEFFKNYIICLAKRVNAKKIDLFFDVGAEDDAYFVSMLSGYVGALFSSLSALLLNRYSGVKIFNSFVPNYEKSELNITGKIIVEFNLITVFISLITALKLTIKQKRR